MNPAGKKHRYISLENLSAGAELADDLLDKQGHVLLPAGSILSANMLKSLEHHGVHQVSVLVELTGSAEEPSLQEKMARLQHLFRGTAESASTTTLYTYLKNFREREMS